MHEDDHDVDRLDHPDHHGVLARRVQPPERPGEGILPQHPRGRTFTTRLLSFSDK